MTAHRVALLALLCLCFTVGASATAQAAPGDIRTVVDGLFGYGGYSGDDGPAGAATINGSFATALAANGDLYIADTYNDRIRKITAASGVITTVAGTGQGGYSGDGGLATAAQIDFPESIAVADDGSVIWTEATNRVARRLSPFGFISTIAGTGPNGSGDATASGPATTIPFGSPRSIDVDSTGNVYVMDSETQLVRRIAGGVVSTYAGGGALIGPAADGGPATAARLFSVYSLAVTDAGTLYFAEYNAGTVRKVAPNGIITTIAGGGSSRGDGGPATAAMLDRPYALATVGAAIYVTELSSGNQDRSVRMFSDSGTISTVAANLRFDPTDVSPLEGGAFYISDQPTNRILVVGDPPDTKPPHTTIAAGPPTHSASASATFAFTSDEPNVSYECRLDSAAGAFVACASTNTFTGLSDGAHTLQVRASDQTGNVEQTPASYSWTVDTLAPETTLTAAPPSPTNDETGDFAFSSPDPDATFECRVDGAAFIACGSPRATAMLSAGPHTFEVRAVDSAGNRDPSPARHDWLLDRTAASTAITSAEPTPTNDPNADFVFDSDEPDATFECSVDDGAFASCASLYETDALGDGPHSLRVRSIDVVGNADPSPASAAWTLDTLVPETVIDSRPPPRSGDSASFAFSSADPDATFQCALDADAFVACSSPTDIAALSDGPHGFRVRAVDLAGNADLSPASASWTVDTETALTTFPASVSGDASGDFEFTSADADATFECRVDDDAYVACTTPYATAPLGDGPHTFDVRAISPLGVSDPTPARHIWTVDTTASETTLTATEPASTSDRTGDFQFSSDDPQATFECRVVGGPPFAACSSPHATASLSPGSHTFEVRAVDSAGNRDASPASHTWMIDIFPPQTTITVRPPDLSNVHNVHYEFSSDEVGHQAFQCRFDGGFFGSCPSPYTSGSLSDGQHTFEVRAVDSAGNIDGSPASDSFTLDTTRPQTTMTSTPSPTTSDETGDFTFSSEVGATFACSIDNSPAVACSSPYATDALADGRHTFTVRATDVAGNTDSSPAGYSWTVDTGADTALSGQPPALSNDPTGDFEFSSEAGATFECRVDGDAFAACDSPYAAAPLADGEHSFEVRATDPLGHVDPSPAAASWTVDTLVPDTTLTASEPSPSNDPTGDFEFSSEAGATFECAVDDDAFAACSSPYETAPVGEGPYTFAVRAIDAAGNTDASPVTHSWVVDTSGPPTTITSAEPSPSHDPTGDFMFSSEPGATFQCRLDTDAFAACDSPHATAPLDDGEHTLQVRAVDAVGNVGATAIHGWTVDTIAPQTTLAGQPSSPTNASTATFEFSADEPATFECRIDAVTFAPCSAPLQTGTLADGPHRFEVRAADHAHNSDQTPASHSWTVDTTAPDTSFAATPPLLSSNPNPAFDFDADEPSVSFQCRLDDAAFSACDDPATLGPLADGAHSLSVLATDSAGNADATPASYDWRIDSGAPSTSIDTKPVSDSADRDPLFAFSSDELEVSYECQLDDATAFSACQAANHAFGPLADGVHTLSVRATDSAGNRDTSPASYTWTVDTVAPDTSITTQPATASSDPNATFSFASDESDVSYRCRLDSAASEPCANPVIFAGLADGEHVLNVQATDAAGNSEATPALARWTVDTAAPAQPAVIDGPNGKKTATSASFAFTGAPGSTFECSLDDAAFAACTSPASYVNLARGEHSFAVREVDEAGNRGAQRTTAFEVVASDVVIKPKSATALELLIAAKITTASQTVTVGCRLNANTITGCKVVAYHDGVKVGAGAQTYTASSRRGAVQVVLNATGRRIIARPGGARLTFKATATDKLDTRLLAKARARVLPQRTELVLSNSSFAGWRSAQLSAAGKRQIVRLTTTLGAAKRIVCIGHSDSRGRAIANRDRGLARARAVCAALRAAGVQTSMRSDSAGESHPRDSNMTAAGRARNRRVELRVTY